MCKIGAHQTFRLFSGGHLAIIPIAVASCFIAGTAPVDRTNTIVSSDDSCVYVVDVDTAECFVVRPENSEDHRRIGSRGAMCLLHVSKWGLTLALQVVCTRVFHTTGSLHTCVSYYR